MGSSIYVFTHFITQIDATYLLNLTENSSKGFIGPTQPMQLPMKLSREFQHALPLPLPSVLLRYQSLASLLVLTVISVCLH
jgi:hypothetical protein